MWVFLPTFECFILHLTMELASIQCGLRIMKTSQRHTCVSNSMSPKIARRSNRQTIIQDDAPKMLANLDYEAL